MCGTITGSPKSPTFNVRAAKDPDGAYLDRIQRLKGWVDASGEPQDEMFDVVPDCQTPREPVNRSSVQRAAIRICRHLATDRRLRHGREWSKKRIAPHDQFHSHEDAPAVLLARRCLGRVQSDAGAVRRV